ncbi:MAG: prepilin-type N-terminal cleavage/methylation domain-containing protein [Planctomycetaceae bacterium]|nr:prepilin-type N-terminal cleavage/methylation domain-containing protein [Planctomycetaceae bacterium]MCB9951009.1 prepilin-type N-terminal cleavage/methylation domain-containing protein [Planctomycetaceae bacterium]
MFSSSVSSLPTSKVLNPRHSRGFTLLELLLVLAIMVAIVAISWPAVGRYLGEQPVKNSAELARRHLGGTRHKSMSTGLIYQFRYEPGGQRFVVLPFEYDPEQVSSSSTVSTSTVMNSDSLPVASGTIDATCHFANSVDAANMFAASGIQTASSTQQIQPELLALLDAGTDMSGVSWSTPILFYPDGTTDDAALSVLDEDQRTINVTLRGLTGVASTEKMQRGGR